MVVHHPVLLKEVVENLNLQPGAQVLDATIGLGGHAEAILKAIGPSGRLIGLDRDQEALALAKHRLNPYHDQIQWVHGHFGELDRFLTEMAAQALDAILFDLGISSLQLDKPERGFSFSREGSLDMRMDQAQGPTAAEMVNHTSEVALRELLRNFGQERWAGRIARSIVRERPLQTTAQLAQVIHQAVPPVGRRGRIDSATRSFQAIRIAVNRELELLPLGLEQALVWLKPGGRIAVLAYHSLEDRIVKIFFREQAKAGKVKVLTRKPIRPCEKEVEANRRSRSACLRVAQRLHEGFSQPGDAL